MTDDDGKNVPTDAYAYDPGGYSLADYIAELIERHDAEFDIHYESSQELGFVARRLVHLSKTLDVALADKELLAAVQRIPETEWQGLGDRFEIELAREYANDLTANASRALELVGYLIAAPNAPTRGYLTRVADCYIRGQSVETAIMCGAALEAALDEYVSGDSVRKYLPRLRQARHIYTGHRVEYLEATVAVPKEVTEKAREILDSRNNAVHVRMDLVGKPARLVQLLAEVLGEIAHLRNEARE